MVVYKEVPGKQSMTTENFDVYMEPLVEEFLQLWEGLSAYDVLKDISSREFTLQGMLMCTIHDYPSYGSMGRFAHQGQGSFFRLHVARKHQKKVSCYKSIKIQDFFWMKKPNINHGL
jgi:hypothetical protein